MGKSNLKIELRGAFYVKHIVFQRGDNTCYSTAMKKNIRIGISSI